VKHWRAVGHVFNVFAIESFVDQMAADAGMDAIAFRQERMNATPKTRALLEKVAQMADWSTPRPPGRALGLSLSDRSGSQGAGVAEVSVDRASGKIRVHKVWLAVDGGTIVQPDMARANIESGIVYGLSSVLHERVTLKGGEVQQSNFHDYHVLRMSDVPEVMEVALMERDTRPTGLGEIGNPWVAEAIASRPQSGVRAFITPTIVFFTTALIVSALMLAPGLTSVWLAVLLGLVGFGGLVYLFWVGGHERWRENQLDREDWIFYIAAP